MATQAHCAYCFETIVAHFEHRQPLPLAKIQLLWDEYHASSGIHGEEEDARVRNTEENARSAALSSTLNRQRDPSAASSSSSTPSSGKDSSVASSATSSRSSLVSTGGQGGAQEEYPLFVTWNTLSKRGEKSLRGCIGTFEARPLGDGLREYAKIR